ncbi:MAG: hypothetical protein KatS3mg091_042 [Patescibacteria group bacterium]|nr:MAG: hypothetical protein KatS3mg091_042 [Patescibacteria group bacterium]
MLNLAKAEDYSQIRLVIKSLGIIVASYYLTMLSKKEQKKFEMSVLEFVIGEVKLDNFTQKLL